MGGHGGALLHLARQLHGQLPPSMSVIQHRHRKRSSRTAAPRRASRPASTNEPTSRTHADSPSSSGFTQAHPRITLTERRAPESETRAPRLSTDVEVVVKPSFPTKGAKTSERLSIQLESNHAGHAQRMFARATTTPCADPWPVTRSDRLRSALLAMCRTCKHHPPRPPYSSAVPQLKRFRLSLKGAAETPTFLGRLRTAVSSADRAECPSP